MKDSDSNRHGADALDEIFAEYKSTLGTERLLDLDALEAIYRQPVPAPVLYPPSRKGWRAAAGPGSVLLWAAILFSLVALDARYQASVRGPSAHIARAVALMQPQNEGYIPSPTASDRRNTNTAAENLPGTRLASRPQNAPAPESFEFRASANVYADHANLDSAVAHDPALGEGWRVADWSDLVQFNSGHSIQGLIKSLNWTRFGSDTTGNYLLKARDQFWLRYNGRSETRSTEQHWEVITHEKNSHRYYFVARMDGQVPKNFKVFAGINNNQVILGSWYDWKFPVLAVRSQGVH